MSDTSNKRQKIEYKCQHCDKTYKKPSKVVEHERSHTGEVKKKKIPPLSLDLQQLILLRSDLFFAPMLVVIKHILDQVI